MKRILAMTGALTLALMLGAALGGCHNTAPPPAWALTAPERTVGDIIAMAESGVVKYKADLKANKSGTDNPQLKAVMQDIQKGLSIAQPAYKVWAAQLKANPAAPEPANLAGAIAAIQTALAELPALTK